MVNSSRSASRPSSGSGAAARRDDYDWNRGAVERLLYRASEQECGPAAASTRSHDEQIVTSGCLPAEPGSRIAAKEPVRFLIATRHLPETFIVMRGDGPGEATGRMAKQVTTLLDHGGANVGDWPDVGERQVPARPLDEVSRRANSRTRLGREIDADEDTKRRDHLADSIAATDLGQSARSGRVSNGATRCPSSCGMGERNSRRVFVPSAELIPTAAGAPSSVI